MIAVSGTAVASARERVSESSWRTNYLGTFGGTQPEDGSPAIPMAFRVEMGADTILNPHFHEVDQYQIFMAGRARFGRHDIQSLAVHYADHHTAYGPIIAGPTGFSYLTLRPRLDSRIVYIRETGYKERLQPSERRQRTADDIGLSIDPVMAARAKASLTPLFDAEADGLAAHILRLGAGMAADAGDPRGSGGIYIFVANGAVLSGGDVLSAGSLMWIGPDEEPARIAAGAGGLEALVLRFPRPVGSRDSPLRHGAG